MKCAAIHENLIEVINHSRFRIEVTFIYKNQDTTTLLKPGENLNGPTYISAEVSRPINESVNFRFTPKRKRKNIIQLVEDKIVSEHTTKHVIHLFEIEVKEFMQKRRLEIISTSFVSSRYLRKKQFQANTIT